MRFLNLRFIIRLAGSVIFLGVLHSPAQADPLTTFTLTDLGPGTPTYSNGGIYSSGNGQTAYTFQAAQATSLNAQQLLSSGFPLLDSPPPVTAPGAYGDPMNVYSTLSNPITNGNGVIVGVDSSGVYGHDGISDSYFVKQNPDGTWSGPAGMWSGGVQFQGFATPGEASITGINALNEVLGVGSQEAVNGPGLPQTYLYNINTNSLLNLNTLGVLQAGWVNVTPIAIDNQGRILLEAALPPTAGSGPEHTLLLTPQGLSSPPVETPAPEPGGLALAVVTVAALALRRAVRNRRRV